MIYQLFVDESPSGMRKVFVLHAGQPKVSAHPKVSAYPKFSAQPKASAQPKGSAKVDPSRWIPYQIASRLQSLADSARCRTRAGKSAGATKMPNSIARSHANEIKVVVDAASKSISRFQPMETSLTLFSLTTLQVRNNELFRAAGEHASALVDSFDTRSLSFLLAAYGRQRFEHPNLFLAAARVISRKAHLCKPKELANMLLSFSVLGYYNRAFYEQLRRQAFLKPEFMTDLCLSQYFQVVSSLNLDNLKAQSIAADSRLFATDSPVDQFFAVLARESLRRLEASVKVQNKPSSGNAGSGRTKKRPLLSDSSLASVTSSYARLIENGYPVDVIFAQALIDYGASSLKDSTGDDLLRSMYGLVRLQQALLGSSADPSESLVAIIKRAVAKGVARMVSMRSQLTSRNWTAINSGIDAMTRLIELGPNSAPVAVNDVQRDQVLQCVERLCKLAVHQSKRFSPRSVQSLCISLSRLSSTKWRPSELLLAVAKYTSTHAKEFSPRETADVLSMMSALNIDHAPAVTALLNSTAGWNLSLWEGQPSGNLRSVGSSNASISDDVTESSASSDTARFTTPSRRNHMVECALSVLTSMSELYVSSDATASRLAQFVFTSLHQSAVGLRGSLSVSNVSDSQMRRLIASCQKLMLDKKNPEIQAWVKSYRDALTPLDSRVVKHRGVDKLV